jgi:hypothetical protein
MLLAQIRNLRLRGPAERREQVAGVPLARLERFCLPLALLSMVLLLVIVGPVGGHAEFSKIVGRGREPQPERGTVVEESWDFGGATFSAFFF